MNLSSSQSELRRRCRAWIETAAAREAFDCLVKAAANLDGCDGYFNQKKRAFVFKHKATGERPHSFIVNRKWLRFYFREPTRSSRLQHESGLLKVFGQRLQAPTDSHLDEWAVNVEAGSEARFLVEKVLRAEFS